MREIAVLEGSGMLLCSYVVGAQDAMQCGLALLKLLAEDDKVRVLKYMPEAGNKTPMHSHPATVLYVIKGGRVKITMPDGSTRDGELKTGEALLRPPVTHADEAIDSLEAILIELKK